MLLHMEFTQDHLAILQLEYESNIYLIFCHQLSSLGWKIQSVNLRGWPWTTMSQPHHCDTCSETRLSVLNISYSWMSLLLIVKVVCLLPCPRTHSDLCVQDSEDLHQPSTSTILWLHLSATTVLSLTFFIERLLPCCWSAFGFCLVLDTLCFFNTIIIEK